MPAPRETVAAGPASRADVSTARVWWGAYHSDGRGMRVVGLVDVGGVDPRIR